MSSSSAAATSGGTGAAGLRARQTAPASTTATSSEGSGSASTTATTQGAATSSRDHGPAPPLPQAATAGWSSDPGAILRRHSGKLKWLVVILIFVFINGISFKKVAAWGICMFLVMVVMLVMRQESLLYVPVVGGMPKQPTVTPQALQLPYEDVTIVTADGPRLHAWFIHRQDLVERKVAHTIIFLHGNAGNIANRLPNYARLMQDCIVNILAVDYRGYGKSTGAPSAAGLLTDARAALDYLHTRSDIDVSKVVIFGRSLGGAVAIALAAEAPERLCGLVLENTFVSVAEMATHVLPIVRPFGPVLPYILKSKWESIKAIPRVKVPILFLAGELDQLVPHEHMQRLYHAATAANGRKWCSFPTGNHNDTFMKGGLKYYAAWREFLRLQCVSARRRKAPVRAVAASTSAPAPAPAPAAGTSAAAPAQDNSSTR